jgi:hypothetical protein
MAPRLAEVLAELRTGGTHFVGLEELLGLADTEGDPAPRVLLVADIGLKGLRSEIVPLLRAEACPLCLMIDTKTPASSVLDLERSLARAEQPMKFEIALRGHPTFENGDLPAERVYAQLLSLRRERERMLQRPCAAYFAAKKSIGASEEDLLQRCGFGVLFGGSETVSGGLWPSANLSSFRVDRWIA